MIKHFFWKFRKLWGRWKWPLNILMTKVLLLVMMLWKCALFPRVACLSGIVQSLGCKPGLSWVNNGRCSQIIAVRKYDNLCFVQLLCPVRWKPHETNQLKLQLSTISCWTLIGESTLEKKIVNLRKLYWIYKQPNLIVDVETNKQTNMAYETNWKD